MDSHTQKHKREKERHTHRNTRTRMQCFVCITSACLRKSLDPVGISREKSYDNRRLSGKVNNFSFVHSTFYRAEVHNAYFNEYGFCCTSTSPFRDFFLYQTSKLCIHSTVNSLYSVSNMGWSSSFRKKHTNKHWIKKKREKINENISM